MSDCREGYIKKTINLNDGNTIDFCVKYQCGNDYTFSDNENIESKIFSLDHLKTSTKPFKYTCIREKSNTLDCRTGEKENKLGQCIIFADQYMLKPDDINDLVSKPQIPVINDIQKRVICATKRNTILEDECSILGGNWNDGKCTSKSSLVELTNEECELVGGSISEAGECSLTDNDNNVCNSSNYVSDGQKCQKYADLDLSSTRP